MSLPVSVASSRCAASFSDSLGRLKPPGIAHIPSYGDTPRRTSSTWSRPSDMVRITTSTVTANAGYFEGLYLSESCPDRVLVATTVTLAQSYGRGDQNLALAWA